MHGENLKLNFLRFYLLKEEKLKYLLPACLNDRGKCLPRNHR